jgi:hypothetical protein
MQPANSMPWARSVPADTVAVGLDDPHAEIISAQPITVARAGKLRNWLVGISARHGMAARVTAA